MFRRPDHGEGSLPLDPKYKDVLFDMAKNVPRFRDITSETFDDLWKQLPVGEQRRALLIAQLQLFLWNHTSRSQDEQMGLIARDANRKGGRESRFGEYAHKMAEVLEQLRGGAGDSRMVVCLASRSNRTRA